VCCEHADTVDAWFAYEIAAVDRVTTLTVHMLGLEAEIPFHDDMHWAAGKFREATPHRADMILQSLKGFVRVFGLQHVGAKDLHTPSQCEKKKKQDHTPFLDVGSIKTRWNKSN